jgi:ATP-dependent Clp protease adaptor protein ClpS
MGLVWAIHTTCQVAEELYTGESCASQGNWIARLDRARLVGLGARGQTVSSTITTPREKKQQKTRGLPPYNVVLLDDDDHSFEYVIVMLKALFGHPPERGYKMAMEVHTTGRVVVATTNLEKAELKRDQIQAFGPDPLIPRCKGSMSAIVEPASG